MPRKDVSNIDKTNQNLTLPSVTFSDNKNNLPADIWIYILSFLSLEDLFESIPALIKASTFFGHLRRFNNFWKIIYSKLTNNIPKDPDFDFKGNVRGYFKAYNDLTQLLKSNFEQSNFDKLLGSLLIFSETPPLLERIIYNCFNYFVKLSTENWKEIYTAIIEHQAIPLFMALMQHSETSLAFLGFQRHPWQTFQIDGSYARDLVAEFIKQNNPEMTSAILLKYQAIHDEGRSNGLFQPHSFRNLYINPLINAAHKQGFEGLSFAALLVALNFGSETPQKAACAELLKLDSKRLIKHLINNEKCFLLNELLKDMSVDVEEVISAEITVEQKLFAFIHNSSAKSELQKAYFKTATPTMIMAYLTYLVINDINFNKEVLKLVAEKILSLENLVDFFREKSILHFTQFFQACDDKSCKEQLLTLFFQPKDKEEQDALTNWPENEEMAKLFLLLLNKQFISYDMPIPDSNHTYSTYLKIKNYFNPAELKGAINSQILHAPAKIDSRFLARSKSSAQPPAQQKISGESASQQLSHVKHTESQTTQQQLDTAEKQLNALEKSNSNVNTFAMPHPQDSETLDPANMNSGPKF